MAEYINKRVALDAIQAERDYMIRREEWLAEHILTHCGYRIIDDLPPADVEPVRHGRWIFGHTLGHSWMKCSECLVSQGGHTACFSYCPNCGARMDGDENADEITK